MKLVGAFREYTHTQKTWDIRKKEIELSFICYHPLNLSTLWKIYLSDFLEMIANFSKEELTKLWCHEQPKRGEFSGAGILEFWVGDQQKFQWYSFQKLINLLWFLNNTIYILSSKYNYETLRKYLCLESCHENVFEEGCVYSLFLNHGTRWP